jgi:hypothetical protein
MVGLSLSFLLPPCFPPFLSSRDIFQGAWRTKDEVEIVLCLVVLAAVGGSTQWLRVRCW